MKRRQAKSIIRKYNLSVIRAGVCLKTLLKNKHSRTILVKKTKTVQHNENC